MAAEQRMVMSVGCNAFLVLLMGTNYGFALMCGKLNQLQTTQPITTQGVKKVDSVRFKKDPSRLHILHIGLETKNPRPARRKR
jgi:hypothetical protein